MERTNTRAVPAVDATPKLRMKLITMKLTIKELELLASLASDQLFRREFIDPRLPGYKANPGDINIGKLLVERLRSLIAPSNPRKPSSARIRG